jgi:DNA-binding LytR/AlgR family response regulator
VGAFNFLLKPVTYFSFASELKRCIEHLKVDRNAFMAVKLDNGIKILKYSEIMYVEVNRHKLSIHAKCGVYEQIGTMKEVEAKLSSTSFTRCNNCYLVNLAFVEGVEDGFAIVGNEKLQISRNKKKSFMEDLTVFYGGVAK